MKYLLDYASDKTRETRTCFTTEGVTNLRKVEIIHEINENTKISIKNQNINTEYK